MDGVYAVAAIAEAIWRFSLCFSVAWAVLYVTAGSWAKVRYRNPKAGPERALEKRYGPVIVSHTLFSVVFANPVCIFFLIWHVGDIAAEAAQLENLPKILSGLAAKYDAIEALAVSTFCLVVAGAYVVLLSLLTDFLVMRLSARVRCLKWLVYRGDSHRWTLAHVVTVLLLLVLAYAASWGLLRVFWG